jgi:hypothetical protein
MFDVSNRDQGIFATALIWPVAKDNLSGLLGYTVWKNGQEISPGAKTNPAVIIDSVKGIAYYLDADKADATNSYAIKSVDNAQNVSGEFKAVVAGTSLGSLAKQKAGANALTLVAQIIGEGKLAISDIIAVPSEIVGQKTQSSINWTTSVPATSRVLYGQSTDYAFKTDLDSGLNSSHLIILSDLTPGTTYHYEVVSTDQYGNQVTSADQTFTTGATTQSQSILELTIQNISQIFARLRSVLVNLPAIFKQ